MPDADPDASPLRVLLVDDSPWLRQSVRAALERAGVVVAHAGLPKGVRNAELIATLLLPVSKSLWRLIRCERWTAWPVRQ